MVFAFLFGLSMDYEVFILSRIKEAHDAGKSTDDAVVDGLGHTGRLVTSAAIILFLAFAALAAGPSVQIKVFATGMAVGILLDATIVAGTSFPPSSPCSGGGTGGCRGLTRALSRRKCPLVLPARNRSRRARRRPPGSSVKTPANSGPATVPSFDP